MENDVSGRLTGWGIHGFRTLQDLDFLNILEEAKMRWLRPNEIYAILCNSSYFDVSMKPVNLPRSGTIVLFDRKILRHFRKDGHSWRKKNDGKTVKEAHEHLKVGDEDKIHVYYAHGEDNPTFVRRSYWLLDKKLEHMVFVHYRETQEGHVTSVNSTAISNQPSSVMLLDHVKVGDVHCADKNDYSGLADITTRSHDAKLRELNTLDWEELIVANAPVQSVPPESGTRASSHNQYNPYVTEESWLSTSPVSVNSAWKEVLSSENLTVSGVNNYISSNLQNPDTCLESHECFGRWVGNITTNSPGKDGKVRAECPPPAVQNSFVFPVVNRGPVITLEQVFSICDVTPSWAYPTERTKIVIVGSFHKEPSHAAYSKLLCVCGDVCVPIELIQVGVYSCCLPPHAAGLVNLFLSFDGFSPVSDIQSFEYRSPLVHDVKDSSEDVRSFEELQIQMKLLQLLFSTSSKLPVFSYKVSEEVLQKGRGFLHCTANMARRWMQEVISIKSKNKSVLQVKSSLLDLHMKNKVRDWLLELIINGGMCIDWDDQGRGVIHLCAILGYTWAVPLFSYSGLSLDCRDQHGWTALHWAAFCGRDKMVAALITAGAKVALVTDPTKEHPGGLAASDLASKNGYDGLGAYLAEKALVEHFEDMILAGNASGSLNVKNIDYENPQCISEDEKHLKDTLAAYRTAADAAARIQAAFRERSLKLRTKALQGSSSQMGSRNIGAALQIQHAFRSYEGRKKVIAAARIQHRFRTWKLRRQFLNTRSQVVKIQAAFRGFQVRRQYRKILWSVGVLEKAILRWRLKRRGLRGLEIRAAEEAMEDAQESDAEDDFFRASRKKAEERIERAVARVQAMFRSKRAQQGYQQMKLALKHAKEEYMDDAGEVRTDLMQR